MKKLIALIMALVMVLSLCACGGNETAAPAEGGDGEVKYDKINLTMAVNGTDTQIDTLVGKKFAELVSEATGGAVVIDVFPNDQLAGGNAAKGMEMLARLFDYFVRYPNKMPELYRRNMKNESVQRCVCDYVASMTDRYAIDLYKELFIPSVWRTPTGG